VKDKMCIFATLKHFIKIVQAAIKRTSKHFEYAFLEKESLLSVVISDLLKDDEKKRLVSVIKKHKEAFAWKTSDIPGISDTYETYRVI
ncbi:hypothetical protein Tco_1232311, partial [Tanacetum coccineum]